MAEKNLEQMQEAVAEIREKMAAAAREAGRDPAAVQLCAACPVRWKRCCIRRWKTMRWIS